MGVLRVGFLRRFGRGVRHFAPHILAWLSAICQEALLQAGLIDADPILSLVEEIANNSYGPYRLLRPP